MVGVVHSDDGGTVACIGDIGCFGTREDDDELEGVSLFGFEESFDDVFADFTLATGDSDALGFHGG